MRVRTTHVCWCAVAALIVGNLTSLVNAAPETRTPTKPASKAFRAGMKAMVDPIEWELEFRLLMDLLCHLIECDAKSDDIQSAVEGFVASYNSHGIQPGLSAAQRAQGLQDTLDAIDLAEGDPGVLAPAARAAILDSLNSMASELNS